MTRAPFKPIGWTPGHYDIGATPYFACQVDQRVSYCLYVPRDYAVEGDERLDLVVAMHGTGRFAEGYRNAFAAFVERERCIVLAPLFAGGLLEPSELSNYKRLRGGDFAFDELLLAMVAEVGLRYRLRSERFCLFGFSGGGHFAHRFLYLHPERLVACSIGAPGVVTLLDPARDWWVGVRNFAEVFGKPLDLAALRRVAVQMVVGGEDTETWEITLKPGSSWWMEDANIAGANRQDRMRSLKASFERHGVAVRHDVVPGVAHDGSKVLEPVERFFAEALAADRGALRREAGE